MWNANWTNHWTLTKGAWASWPNMYPYNWLVSWQNKNFKGKPLSGLLFTVKILQETMHLTFPYLYQITYN